MNLKTLLKETPIVGTILKKIYRSYISATKPFQNSEKYWIERYQSGDNSGDGSYGKLSEFKAEFINKLVKENDIKSVIEFGSGDGNQLKLAHYDNYIGFDISQEAINLCKNEFKDKNNYNFKLLQDYQNETADLTLSLDVIYHLIEDMVFDEYMQRLFNSSNGFVIIYSSNTDLNNPKSAPHFKNRKFTDWCENQLKSEWHLIDHTPNKYPLNLTTGEGSVSDFFVYQKK